MECTQTRRLSHIITPSKIVMKSKPQNRQRNKIVHVTISDMIAHTWIRIYDPMRLNIMCRYYWFVSFTDTKLCEIFDRAYLNFHVSKIPFRIQFVGRKFNSHIMPNRYPIMGFPSIPFFFSFFLVENIPLLPILVNSIKLCSLQIYCNNQFVTWQKNRIGDTLHVNWRIVAEKPVVRWRHRK